MGCISASSYTTIPLGPSTEFTFCIFNTVPKLKHNEWHIGMSHASNTQTVKSGVQILAGTIYAIDVQLVEW